MFFETVFGLQGLTGEQQVCCPFPHTKADGTTYYDHSPSMGINLDKRVYSCRSCGARGNEPQMVAKMFNTTLVKATNFLNMLNYGEDVNTIYAQYESVPVTDTVQAELDRLGVTHQVLQDCMVTVEEHGGKFDWEIPVMWYDRCIDIRHYRPGRTPKMYGEAGAPTGAIIPHDKWLSRINSATAAGKTVWTILCAGEKDMLVTRSHGLEAITFTGGEMLHTPLDVTEFKGQKIAICYDNDQAGRVGAKKIAETLLAAGAKEVRVVTKFHEDFLNTDTKEDLTDWFTNYGGTGERLKDYIMATPTYVSEVKVEEDDAYKRAALSEVIKPEARGNYYRSKVQVLTCSDEAFEVPKVAKVWKATAQKGIWEEGHSAVYDLDDHTEGLFLCLGKSKPVQVEAIKKIMTPPGEKGCACSIKSTEIVYVAQVADVDADFEHMTELSVFCVGFRPVQGRVYDMEFLRTTNDLLGTVCAVSHNMVEADDATKEFVITPQIKASIEFGAHVMGSVKERVSHRARAVRGLLGYEADERMITAIDLTMNSVKEFKYGTISNIKGYLDTLVIGESRVGKSDTAKRLRDAYNVGAFVSLAGAAATIPGIVGGSAKDAMGRMSTRAGVIPRNNDGCIILEEVSKADPTVIKSLTDIRSSGRARITRVSGSVEMPASLRMVSLSNARPMGDGTTRSLNMYSSGVEVVQELVGTAEDIARYDMVTLVGDPETINPLYHAEEPYPEEVLQDLIRWVWSRKQDQIQWADDTEQLIYKYSTELNNKYPLPIKLFGSECWKKLARIAISAAAYTCSHSEDYENIVVTPEHAEFARDFLEGMYANPLFKLEEMVRVHEASTKPNPEDTSKLQDYYNRYFAAIDTLYEQKKVDKLIFRDLSGIEDASSFGAILKLLVARHFITTDRMYMVATPKFLRTYELIDKNREVPRVGY